MIPGLVTHIPAGSSMQVQHVEGGFLCVIPPGAPIAAKLSGDVAAFTHLFLGTNIDPEQSSVGESGIDLSVPVLFDWPLYQCPQGSVFQATKIPRIDGRTGRNRGYMVTYHTAALGSAHQVVAFERGSVMEHLKRWLLSGGSQEAESTSSLIALAGMRPNPYMNLSDERIFNMRVSHASQLDNYTGPTPYVAISDDPRMALGVVDISVLEFLVEELGGDMTGEFAARIDEGWLEFGPRLDGDDAT